jgi:hypothetical protein
MCSVSAVVTRSFAATAIEETWAGEDETDARRP